MTSLLTHSSLDVTCCVSTAGSKKVALLEVPDPSLLPQVKATHPTSGAVYVYVSSPAAAAEVPTPPGMPPPPSPQVDGPLSGIINGAVLPGLMLVESGGACCLKKRPQESGAACKATVTPTSHSADEQELLAVH
jgi:hypothetical protein